MNREPETEEGEAGRTCVRASPRAAVARSEVILENS
jgi:hypothetical protein